MTTSLAPSATPDTSEQAGRSPLWGVVIGLIAMASATVAGLLLAFVLVTVGITQTPVLTLGIWLSGAGIWGGWQQDVTSTMANGAGWSLWVAGAPLLVTAAAGLPAAALFRRWRTGAAGAFWAAAAAGTWALGLVLVSARTETTTNSAGAVTIDEHLTWWWSGGTHPGTVAGAALLLLIVGLANTWARQWWDDARHVAWAVIVVPGLIITVAVAAGAFWLTSSASAAVALVTLYPLVGALTLFAGGGVPVEFGLSRVSPEPFVLWTWQQGLVVTIGATVAVLVVAAIVGLVLRLRHTHCPFWVGVIGTAFFTLWLALLMNTVVAVPAALGAESTLSVNPVGAAAVGAVMAPVALLIARRRLPEGSASADTVDEAAHSEA